jgi:hypothetical protein
VADHSRCSTQFLQAVLPGSQSIVVDDYIILVAFSRFSRLSISLIADAVAIGPRPKFYLSSLKVEGLGNNFPPAAEATLWLHCIEGACIYLHIAIRPLHHWCRIARASFGRGHHVFKRRSMVPPNLIHQP